MIRWFLVKYLNGRDVMRLTSVKKLVTDIMFSQGKFRKLDFEHFIKQHFKAQKIPACIWESKMANLDRSVFSSIHQQISIIDRLQEGINSEFERGMEKLG